MRRGVSQPPSPLHFHRRAVHLVVMLWVDVLAGLIPVCEALAPGGHPGPRLGAAVVFVFALLAPGLIWVAVWAEIDRRGCRVHIERCGQDV